MSAESDLIALLAASPSITALGASKVFLNAADEATPAPYIVVTSTRDLDKTLEGSTDTTHITYTIATWGQSALQVESVADAITTTIDDANTGVEILNRTGGFDPDTAMDACVLLADEWR